LKIATWNVNSINSRFEYVANWLEENNIDILLIQETKTTDENFPENRFKELGYFSYFYGQKTYNGVAIISRFELDKISYGFPNGYNEDEKRLVYGRFKGINLISIYIPNGRSPDHPQFQHKLEFVKELTKLLRTSFPADDRTLLAGDFNIAPRPIDVFNPELLKNSVGFNPEEREAFNQIIKLGYIDIFARIYPDVQKFSWWDYRAGAFYKNLGMRIDNILITENLFDLISDCHIDRDARKKKGELKPSDHSPVVAVFKEL